MYTISKYGAGYWVRRGADLHAIRYTTMTAARAAQTRLERGLAKFQPVAAAVRRSKTIPQ